MKKLKAKISLDHLTKGVNGRVYSEEAIKQMQRENIPVYAGIPKEIDQIISNVIGIANIKQEDTALIGDIKLFDEKFNSNLFEQFKENIKWHPNGYISKNDRGEIESFELTSIDMVFDYDPSFKEEDNE